MKKLILITTVIVTACAYKVKEPIRPMSFIETCELDTTKIRYDGYYNKIVDTLYTFDGLKYSVQRKTANELVVFNKNKNVFIDANESTNDSSSFNCMYYQKIASRIKKYKIKYLKYTIKNDSLYTYNYILITVGAGQRVPVYCNFRGFVKNRDTITDWKLIPPYPKDFTKSVLKWNADLLEPHTLYFVKTDAVKCLKME
jgi:hypothetical protein